MRYIIEKLADSSIIIWCSCSFGMYPIFRFTQQEARDIMEKLKDCINDIPEAFKVLEGD